MIERHPIRLSREQAQALARQMRRDKKKARQEDAIKKRRQQEGNT